MCSLLCQSLTATVVATSTTTAVTLITEPPLLLLSASSHIHSHLRALWEVSPCMGWEFLLGSVTERDLLFHSDVLSISAQFVLVFIHPSAVYAALHLPSHSPAHQSSPSVIHLFIILSIPPSFCPSLHLSIPPSTPDLFSLSIFQCQILSLFLLYAI